MLKLISFGAIFSFIKGEKPVSSGVGVSVLVLEEAAEKSAFVVEERLGNGCVVIDEQPSFGLYQDCTLLGSLFDGDVLSSEVTVGRRRDRSREPGSKKMTMHRRQARRNKLVGCYGG